jgi:exodeoxyribonuclease VII small subunit
MATEKKEPVDFEKALEKLQNTVRQIEGGELSLEGALKSFEEGVSLARSCQEYLQAAEKRVETLTQSPSPDAPPKIE